MNTQPTARLLASLDSQCFAPAEAWSEQDYAGLLATRGVAGWVWEAPAPQALLCFRIIPPEAEILRIGVLPAQRRMGLGGRLMSTFLERFPSEGVHHLFLEVRADNLPALAMYWAQGFRETGRRPGYYRSPPGDAVLMAWDCDPS